MARFITLRFAGRCADCGASLPVGSRARWYGRGRVYGIGCHTRDGTPTGDGGKMMWIGGKRVRGSRCEDAPCCGCCGSGSDDPIYNPYAGSDY